MVSYDQYGNVKLQNSLQLRMGLFFFFFLQVCGGTYELFHLFTV